ncbi:retrovirus-related pol polyprotein from transposon TNT 1-94, partial [Tanacetum coccineum]
CTTAQSMCNVLILAHEGPSDTRDTKVVALRLKFNAFKVLECEYMQGTFTRLKILLNDLENKGVSIPQAEVNATFVNSSLRKWFTVQASSSKALISNTHSQDSNSDVEEDTRSKNEFLADLNDEFHDRAFLANQKRFYKRSGRVRSARKPMDKTNETCFTCVKQGHFQKNYPTTKTSTPSYPSSNKSYNKPKSQSNSSQQHNQNNETTRKDYIGKYKALKSEVAILTKKIDAMAKNK